MNRILQSNKFRDTHSELVLRSLTEIFHSNKTASQFHVVYQPQFNVNTNEVIGLEALLRWNHPVLGAISPQEFIPLTEHLGLVSKVGGMVLKKVCADMPVLLSRWPHIRVAINTSAQELSRADFADQILEILSEHGDYAEHLEIEITETPVVFDHLTMREQLTKLREHGMTIAIDDFATGQANLARLLTQPFDKIKLDISLVRAISIPLMAAFAEAITQIANKFKFSVVAEGIEEFEQLDTLMRIGCHTMQGYLICPPVELPKLPTIITLRDRREQLLSSGAY